MHAIIQEQHELTFSINFGIDFGRLWGFIEWMKTLAQNSGSSR